jgi:hypothetical protein
MRLFDIVEHRPTADGCLIVIRRRDRNEESQVVARNFQVINTLQTEEVEGRLAARPGVYDGRKNLYTSFKLESESLADPPIPHEASQSCHRSSKLNVFSAFMLKAHPHLWCTWFV